MRWSFRIATILGTEVRIHATFALLLAYFAWPSLANGEGWLSALEAVGLVLAMFTCVLLHEFGHVLAARRYGIRTPEIMLLPIGGVAKMERMPRKPSEELIVALCGPLVNFVIAALIWVGLQLTPDHMMDRFLQPGNFWITLMVWNLGMIVFNMIPAFPMDGGRVLRATLAMFMSDYAKATRLAATLGQAIAVIVAVLLVGSGQVAHAPMAMLVTVFVFLGAGQEAAMVSEQEAARGLRVADAMMTEFHALSPNARLAEAVRYMLDGAQQDFPVMGDDGLIAGVLSRRALIFALSDRGPNAFAKDVAARCEAVLEPSTPLSVAMELLRTGACHAVPVADPVHDRLVGLVTAENIAEMLMVRDAERARRAAQG